MGMGRMEQLKNGSSQEIFYTFVGTSIINYFELIMGRFCPTFKGMSQILMKSSNLNVKFK